MKKPIVLLTLIAFATGCSHVVAINTNPAGARIRLDGTEIGRSPTTFVDNGGTGRTYTLEADAPGYQPRTMVLHQEWSGACTGFVVAGIFFLLPLIGLVACQEVPRDNYDITLDPAAPQAPPAM